MSILQAMKKIEEMSTEEKIDFLIEKVQRIDRTVNPPLWKVIGKWCLLHIPLLIGLGLVAYMIWIMRDEIRAMIVLAQQVETQYSEMKTLYGEIQQTVESLKFW
jgi:hypothetical protein